MKLTDRYYRKIYRQTSKLTKKLFNQDIVQCLASRYSTKKYIENMTGKKIEDVTSEDIRQNKIGYFFVKYKTICKVLEVVETACTLKSFTIEEYENEC